MNWLAVIAVLFFLFLFLPREMLAILIGTCALIPIAWVTSLIAGWLPDFSVTVQDDGELVIFGLGAVVVIAVWVTAIRQFIWKWFTPEQGRLLYFLVFLLALFVIGTEVGQPAAQPERASPPQASPADEASPAEKALQELLLGDQLTPLN